jgi:hypothetical protein
MRDELAKLYGKRRCFQGVFVRFGKKAAYKGEPLTTILLEDITDVASQKVVASHVWFTLGKGFERLTLQKDDVVRFWARVSKYVKGYKGRRDVDKPLEQDYRLSFPTKLTRLPRGSIARELRAFNETVKSASEALKE